MRLQISYTFTQPQPQIELLVRFNDELVMHKKSDGLSHEFKHDFADSDDFVEVKLTIGMTGKTHQHTEIDQSGNIVSDSAVIIDSIAIDGIDVTEIFCQGLPCYEHDGNGSQDRFRDEFYGYMGCNGEVSIDFTLPLYQWFLEHCQ